MATKNSPRKRMATKADLDDRTARPSLIINLSSKRRLPVRLEKADTMLSRMRGLMFRRKPASILFVFPSEGIYPIHSFFVPFEFDAVYLDSQWRVSGIFERIRPFVPFISPPSPSLMLLELEAGASRKLGLKIGDRIAIKMAEPKSAIGGEGQELPKTGEGGAPPSAVRKGD
ncbi:MAG: DUF192 domain-containing protein [Candidatus Micrarchaeota archaeon]